MKVDATSGMAPIQHRSPLASWVGRHELGLFFGLAFLVSWVAWPLTLLNPDSSPLVPFGPLIAAVVVAALAGGTPGLGRLLGQLGKWRQAPGWYLVALLGPLALTIAAAGLAIAFGASPLGHGVDGTQVALTFAVTIVLVGLFEELGWRGFALPRMQRRLGGLAAAGVLGAVWALWHLPELVSDPTGQRPPLPFLVLVLAQSVVFAWLYNSTNAGLVSAVLAHAATNTAAQFILPRFTGAAYELVWWCFTATWVVAAALAVILAGPGLNAHRRSISHSG